MVPLLAYIGPGAGFAFLGSFLILIAALALSALALLALPFRLAWNLFRHRRSSHPKAQRIIVLGMDGLDPRRVQSMMDRGELPNFARLGHSGRISEMTSSCPPISPVAWSSFMTGVNPGKHNIFDFLNRDLRSLRPELSSARISSPARHRWRQPAAEITGLRKSQPFWHLLMNHGVFSAALRVPITFPPEPFGGLSLSAMCVPDLRGSQGTFTVFEEAGSGRSLTGGQRIEVVFQNGRADTLLEGPRFGNKSLSVPLVFHWASSQPDLLLLNVSGETLRLQRGVHSPWVRLSFRSGWRRIHGIARFQFTGPSPTFRLYVTPVQIDPEHPALPIGNPASFPIYLAKLIGPFATLGLAEDTWARNEGVLDEAGFQAQAESIQAEREAMFFALLDRIPRGFLTCVFDLPDRIQHLFWADQATADNAIAKAYRQMDVLLGQTLDRLDPESLLWVMSDHGFASFRRGVNLNAWLRDHGWLTLKPDATDADFLGAIDWSRTRAYSFGLSGIYLNLRGREAQGIVNPDEVSDLKNKILTRLSQLTDPLNGSTAIVQVYDNHTIYTGPYAGNGPDLIVGFADGYRASWENAVGAVSATVFSDNTRHWCGDHCVDRSLVPAFLACNRPFNSPDGKSPSILDLAPTILHLFGITPPGYMDGTILTGFELPHANQTK
jgi:predicted AlkP superfamily phosphohydrolase/phosphomutase